MRWSLVGALIALACSEGREKIVRIPTAVAATVRHDVFEPYLCERIEAVVVGGDAIIRVGEIRDAGGLHCYEVSLAASGGRDIRITLEIGWVLMPNGTYAVEEWEFTIPAAEFPMLVPVENFFPPPRVFRYRITLERAPAIPVAHGDTIPT